MEGKIFVYSERNVITLEIILRNEIPGNNNLFKAIDTLIFVLKQIPNYKKKKKKNPTLTSFHYIMNPCTFGTQIYS